VEEDELRKDEKKMKNTSINLYYFDFIVVKKNCKNWLLQKNFCTNLIYNFYFEFAGLQKF